MPGFLNINKGKCDFASIVTAESLLPAEFRARTSGTELSFFGLLG